MTLNHGMIIFPVELMDWQFTAFSVIFIKRMKSLSLSPLEIMRQYEYPYGISPRIPLKGKVNEGIPLDHNLNHL